LIFLHTNQDISSKEDFCGLCPHPVSGIRLGISGNTANVDGVRLEQFMVYGILFQPLRLQLLGEPVPIKDNHLVTYLIPVPVTLRPFFDHVPTGKIEHFF
jgi:hypothetical protein